MPVMKLIPHNSRITSAAVLAGILAAVLMLPAPSAGAFQATPATQQRPPVPSQTAEPPVITTFLLMAVLLAVGIGAQAFPSKRGHQD